MVFKNIRTIGYEGRDSRNPLAFKYYKADEVVLGRTMADWTRFAAAYWHTLGADGTDMFGWGTMQRPWTTISDPMEKAKVKVDAIFEFCEKLGILFFCFHDRDIAPEGDTLRETCLLYTSPSPRD